MMSTTALLHQSLSFSSQLSPDVEVYLCISFSFSLLFIFYLSLSVSLLFPVRCWQQLQIAYLPRAEGRCNCTYTNLRYIGSAWDRPRQRWEPGALPAKLSATNPSCMHTGLSPEKARHRTSLLQLTHPHAHTQKEQSDLIIKMQWGLGLSFALSDLCKYEGTKSHPNKVEHYMDHHQSTLYFCWKLRAIREVWEKAIHANFKGDSTGQLEDKYWSMAFLLAFKGN